MQQCISRVERLGPYKVVLSVVNALLASAESSVADMAEWREQAAVRLTCYTHADLLTQAEMGELSRHAARVDPHQGVAFLNLRDAQTMHASALEPVRLLLLGAITRADTDRALVCGLPNAGKSSLILQLTRALTLEHKKKGHHHLPRVSSIAGKTTGLKVHRLYAPRLPCTRRPRPPPATAPHCASGRRASAAATCRPDSSSTRPACSRAARAAACS